MGRVRCGPPSGTQVPTRIAKPSRTIGDSRIDRLGKTPNADLRPNTTATPQAAICRIGLIVAASMIRLTSYFPFVW
jgi:hypothetical protein